MEPALQRSMVVIARSGAYSRLEGKERSSPCMDPYFDGIAHTDPKNQNLFQKSWRNKIEMVEKILGHFFLVKHVIVGVRVFLN